MSVPWRLVERGTARLVVERLEIASGYWSRFAGLQLRRRPSRGYGLLLAPCSSIHTCFMRFAIDVVMLDSSGRVIEVRHGVRPWRAVVPRQRTFAILEIPAADAVTIEAGQWVRIDRANSDHCELPKRLVSWVWPDDR
jgi:uncharacterized membrane protein (UPF0127 family)